MKCPNHPTDDLKKEDFYWHKGNLRLKNPCCIKCVLKKCNEKRKEKLEYQKMFSIV